MFGGNRGFFGGGLLGGLAAGFIGAGLFGLLFGHGLFGGLGGLVSILGLLLQVGLIAFIGMMLWRYFQRRNPAYAGNAGGGPLYRDGSGVGSGLGSGLGMGLGLGLSPRRRRGPAQRHRGHHAGPTTTRSNARSAKSRRPTATKTSPPCGRM